MRPLAQNLLLSLASASLFLGGAEALCRWTEGDRPLPTVADYITDWGDEDFYTIKTSATGWPPWEDYNSDGLRDREHSVQKPPRVQRIACLGDSVTLGWGVSPQEAYPQLLQDRLDAQGWPAEVFNVALGGWSTRQERIAYSRIARRYGPDVVLLGICLNDVPELQNNLARPPRALRLLHAHSALVRRAIDAKGREIKNVEELFESRGTPRVREAFTRLFAEIRALRREVNADGAGFAVLVFPFRFQLASGSPPPTVQDEIAAFCREEGIRMLDLLPALREVGEAAFIDYDHLTAAGARRVAHAIVDSGLLGEEGLAPPAPQAAVTVSAAVGGAGAADLLAALDSEDARRRAGAARALGNLRSEPQRSVPALQRALGDRDPGVRTAAAWALGGFEGEAAPAVPALAELLQDADPRTRSGAAWALGRIGPPAKALAAARLAERLDDGDESVRWRVADALARVGADCEGCLPVLVKTLADPVGRGRGEAAACLGVLGPAARVAVAPLAAALGDPRPDVRGRAAWALGRIGPDARDAVLPLIGLVRDPDVGWRAIDALGAMGAAAQPAVPHLVQALSDPSGNVRWRAAQALAQMGTAAASAIDPLAEALSGDAEDNVRLACAKALSRVGAEPSRVLPPLARALRDRDTRVRVEAAHGLGRIGAAAHPFLWALIPATRDGDAYVRAAAARALGRVGPSREATAALDVLFRSDPDSGVRAEARKALRVEAGARR